MLVSCGVEFICNLGGRSWRQSKRSGFGKKQIRCVGRSLRWFALRCGVLLTHPHSLLSAGVPATPQKSPVVTSND